MNILSFIKFALIVAVLLYLHIQWAKYRINEWAKQNHYRITSCRFCFQRIGPFSYFGTSAGQYIFKIEAINPDGQIRTGYARAGGFFFGLLRKRVEVKWDKGILDLE